MLDLQSRQEGTKHAKGQLTINFRILELSRRDLVIEEQVDLTERSVLGFWEAVPAPDVAEQIRAGVEETGFGSPVPGYRRRDC